MAKSGIVTQGRAIAKKILGAFGIRADIGF